MTTNMLSENLLNWLSKPVSFPCSVKGHHLIAKVVAIVDNPIYFIYRIEFDDGFIDNFALLGNGWIEPDKKEGKPYAWAIQNDLNSITITNADSILLTLRRTIEGEQTNVWIIQDKSSENETYYTVHYNGDYRFELKRDRSGWVAKTKRVINPGIIDQKLAAEIGVFIEKELRTT